MPSPHRLPLALALPVVDLLARATRRGHVYELLELLVALLVVAWASDLRRC